MSAAEAGGFLPSPPVTHGSPTPSASAAPSTLPTPRATPLRPGSAKEAALRRYAEDRLLRISARYERRLARQAASREPEPEPRPGPRPAADEPAYSSFAEAAADLLGVLTVVWVSGTASLQIPFLFTIAHAAAEYVPAFAFAPRATFGLLRALDAAFASLIAGEDVDSRRPLPPGRRLTTTEKVRLRGVAERMRVRVARAAAADGSQASRVEEVGTDTDDDELEGFGSRMEDVQVRPDDRGAEDPAGVEMGVAGVFQRTIVALGPALEGAEEIGFSNC